MPNRQEPFSNNEIYHITARRIGDELLFKNVDDYYRGVFSIYEFNTTKLVTIRERRKARVLIKKEVADSGRTTDAGLVDGRNKLVEILTFSLMPNHIHLLLKQIKEGGISKFMQKLGTGYAEYFKEKYNQKRKGHFFQDRFHSVHIKDDNQLKVVFVYVHTNVISLTEPNWKKIGIKNPKKVIKFIENYKWHSYSDYLGKKNFSSVTDREFILDLMGGEKGCRKEVENWIRYKGKLREALRKFEKMGFPIIEE